MALHGTPEDFNDIKSASEVPDHAGSRSPTVPLELLAAIDRMYGREGRLHVRLLAGLGDDLVVDGETCARLLMEIR
jgi:hypothetical protein